MLPWSLPAVSIPPLSFLSYLSLENTQTNEWWWEVEEEQRVEEEHVLTGVHRCDRCVSVMHYYVCYVAQGAFGLCFTFVSVCVILGIHTWCSCEYLHFTLFYCVLHYSSQATCKIAVSPISSPIHWNVYVHFFNRCEYHILWHWSFNGHIFIYALSLFFLFTYLFPWLDEGRRRPPEDKVVSRWELLSIRAG